MDRKNSLDKFLQLRTDFKEFVYESYSYDVGEEGLEIEYNFSIDDLFSFNPKIRIPFKEFIDFERISAKMMNQLVFNIGMVELISYWKCICPRKVMVKPYSLDCEQISFWKEIYFHGLGEFFYLNSIDVSMDDFMSLESRVGAPKMSLEDVRVEDAALIPVGGGKDSVVSLEVLKGSGNNLALIMNPRGASIATANIGGFEHKTFVVKRILDKKLLELNKEGYLNGHTPFSALLAFVSVLAAAVSGKKYIALSNESSANESTVIGTKVNHQYSKSLEFEKDFRDYVSKNLTNDIKYFSLLRPISELQIASIFAQNKDYFFDFRSCNVGSKTDSWCGKCPKCLFTFIIMSPFIDPKVLVEVFGVNMLDDKGMKNSFDDLSGASDVKPFECVGTVDEVKAALCLSLEMYPDKLPFLLQYFKDSDLFKECSKIDKDTLLSAFEDEHFLPSDYLDLLKSKLNR